MRMRNCKCPFEVNNCYEFICSLKASNGKQELLLKRKLAGLGLFVAVIANAQTSALKEFSKTLEDLSFARRPQRGADLRP